MPVHVQVLGQTCVRGDLSGRKLELDGDKAALITMLALDFPSRVHVNEIAEAMGNADLPDYKWLNDLVSKLNKRLQELPELSSHRPVKRKQDVYLEVDLGPDVTIDVGQHIELARNAREASFSPEGYERAWRDLEKARALLPSGGPLLPGLRTSEVQEAREYVLQTQIDLAQGDWFKVGFELSKFHELEGPLQTRFDKNPQDIDLCLWLASVHLSSHGEEAATATIERHCVAVQKEGLTVTDRVLAFKDSIRAKPLPQLRSEPLRTELRFNTIPWANRGSAREKPSSVDGNWLQVTYDPADVNLAELPWSIEWVAAQADEGELRGAMWRVWPQHFERSWTFAGVCEDAGIRGSYNEWTGQGRSGTFNLPRVGGIFVGVYSLHRHPDYRGLLTILGFEGAPMIWLRPHEAQGTTIVDALEQSDRLEVWNGLPQEQHQGWNAMMTALRANPTRTTESG